MSRQAQGSYGYASTLPARYTCASLLLLPMSKMLRISQSCVDLEKNYPRLILRNSIN